MIVYDNIQFSVEGVRGLSFTAFNKKFGQIITGDKRACYEFVKTELKKHPKPRTAKPEKAKQETED